MNDAIARVLRELPDTDKSRYDIAYERGRAQARSSMLFGGLVIGALIGAVTTFFLDPERGKARRHEAGRQFVGRRNDLARVLEGRLEDVRNRVEGAAIEAGVASPPGGGTDAADVDGRASEAGEAGIGAERERGAEPEARQEGAGREEREPVLARQWTAGGSLGESDRVARG